MFEIEVVRAFPGFSLNAAFRTSARGITALFGRSGAGKTTLVNLLAGLDRPDGGRIALGDKILFDSERKIEIPPERRRIGYVFQEDRLFPHMSVARNLDFGRRRRRPRGETTLALEQVVEVLGIGHLMDRRPRSLSGGEKQRVQIGRALLSEPRLLLMDEPLANLDVPRRAEVLPVIEAMRDKFGVPVIYVSHNMDEVVRLADTIVLLSEGRVIAAGSVEEVTSRLDLRPLTGRYEAGAVLAARVAGHDAGDGLTRLEFEGGALWVSKLDLQPGAPLRVRVRARDVAIARQPPEGSSILNVLPVTVAEIGDEADSQVDILLRVGEPPSAAGASLWARITRRSVRELELAPGAQVYALIKAVAIDRHSLGPDIPRPRFLAGES